MRRNDFVGDSGVVERGTTLVPKKTLFTRGAACHDRGGCRWHRGALGLATRPRTRAHSMFFTLTLLAGAAAYQPATLPRHRDASSLSNLQMMAKKPKTDPRVWVPKRSSPYAREVDVALQLVSRASAAVGKGSLEVANIAAQALVSDGIGSEFSDDTVMATQSAATLKAVDAGATLELINEIGATTPCVNDSCGWKRSV